MFYDSIIYEMNITIKVTYKRNKMLSISVD